GLADVAVGTGLQQLRGLIADLGELVGPGVQVSDVAALDPGGELLAEHDARTHRSDLHADLVQALARLLRLLLLALPPVLVSLARIFQALRRGLLLANLGVGFKTLPIQSGLELRRGPSLFCLESKSPALVERLKPHPVSLETRPALSGCLAPRDRLWRKD